MSVFFACLKVICFSYDCLNPVSATILYYVLAVILHLNVYFLVCVSFQKYMMDVISVFLVFIGLLAFISF